MVQNWDWLKDLQESIDELLACDAFELQMHIDENGQTYYYIPYMMNDALECYFVLKDCRMTGEYVASGLSNSSESDVSGDSDDFGNFACNKRTQVSLIENGSTPALVLRQPDGNVATLWFNDVVKELKCYRYHEIGHFWVKGQEQWRQLVYIIGTIYDKFEYMGESICNDEELALLPLMEFAPFRYWSPIHESLDGHYPDTLNGIACFRALCEEVGDNRLLKLVNQYEKVACSSGWLGDFYGQFLLPRIVRKLALELTKSGHEALYELIYQKVCDASSRYPARDYGEDINKKVDAKRALVIASLVDKGFVGEYPRFSKGNVSVVVTEEHPFTISMLEYDNYDFRIQLMVSETDGTAKFLNQGFFKGSSKGIKNRGWIAKSGDELL